jgi:dnd system-associated protein 4
VAIRIRRPKAHAELLDKLCEGSGNPFNHLYEALLFAASLGFARGAREPFEEADEPVRWEQFMNIDGSEELVDMLAAAATEDKEVMSEASAEQRYALLEEYANGGLGVIASALESSPAKTTREVVLDLVLAEQQAPPSDLDFESIVEGLD